jgi:F-type H+-transporting ATPase subunit gamma
MATLREIKLRIRSIKSTQKITKAMEMVSASKMRRAQQQALGGRPYLEKLGSMISNLVFLSNPPISHPLLNEKEVKNRKKRVGYILVTSNRGLCGAFNSNMIRGMLEILKNETQEEKVLTVGRKGRQAMERIGKNVLADFETISDKPTFVETLGISKVMIDDFINGDLDEVWVAYNHFHSTLTQKPLIKKILPIEANKDLTAPTFKSDFIFEGNREKLLDGLLTRYIETSVYQTILESLASEQSARMVAMRKASDNAKEIVGSLTLQYNKGRQAKITTQILEIVSGSASV